MGPSFGNGCVTLSFMRWPPLFSGLPPLGFGPHMSSTGICKKCETFNAADCDTKLLLLWEQVLPPTIC